MEQPIPSIPAVEMIDLPTAVARGLDNLRALGERLGLPAALPDSDTPSGREAVDELLTQALAEQRAQRTALCGQLIDAAETLYARGDDALAGLQIRALARIVADAQAHDPFDTTAQALRAYLAALAGTRPRHGAPSAA